MTGLDNKASEVFLKNFESLKRSLGNKSGINTPATPSEHKMLRLQQKSGNTTPTRGVNNFDLMTEMGQEAEARLFGLGFAADTFGFPEIDGGKVMD